MGKINDVLKITYENGMSKINMVIETKAALKFINYQYEMLANNTCKGVMAVSSRQKDEQVYLYYDITSRLTLSQYLKGRRISKDDFIKIISSILETISNSKGYLLYEHCFVLEKDYIYIKPGSCDAQLVYLPFELPNNNADSALKNLLIEIIMSSDFDEVNEDNFLQRILCNVKSETFCLNELRKLLKEISYNKIAVDSIDFEYQEYSEEDLHDENEETPKKNEIISVGWGFFALVTSQIIVCLFLFALLKADIIKDMLTRYSVSLVTIASDIFIIAKFIRRLPKIKQAQISVKENYNTEEESHKKEDQSSNRYQNEDRYEEDDRYINEDCYEKEVRYTNEDSIEKVDKYTNQDRLVKTDRYGMRDQYAKEHKSIQGSEVAAAVDGQKEIKDKRTLSEDATMLLSINDISKEENKLPYACFRRNINGVLEEIHIAKKYFTFGRLEGQVDYVCKSSAVGRIHAEITYKEGAFHIKDLNSRNGTYINNERLDSNKDYLISDKDKISFANYEYNLSIL